MEDYMIRVLTKNKQIRALAVRSTNLVEEARQIHKTTPVATAALGRALSAVSMMIALEKSGEKVGLRIIGDGPLDRVIAEASMDGEVKGFVGNPQIDIMLNEKKNKKKLNVKKAIGNGELYVRKMMGLKEPYESKIQLISGEIGEDLTYYYTKSEQVPSSVGLGVLVDTDSSVKAAGGFIIQLLPETPEETISKLESNLNSLGSVSRLIETGITPEELLDKVLEGFPYDITKVTEVGYNCNCSKERTLEIVNTLNVEEIKESLKEDGYVEVTCHYCNESYRYNEEYLKEHLEREW
ncbi:MAG: Hsp33 family molecular chaperone HslO [Halanaerobiales bacterium]|nr:Hsp33 family molecular chaperone HslO [Halanaerobiales bacterium]